MAKRAPVVRTPAPATRTPKAVPTVPPRVPPRLQVPDSTRKIGRFVVPFYDY